MTSKSAKNPIVLAAITILYLANVTQGLMQWVTINFLIGTSGESAKQNLNAESASFANNYVAQDVIQFLPYIVADGLLVSCEIRLA